jgi:predicted HTH domain antitoxin
LEKELFILNKALFNKECKNLLILKILTQKMSINIKLPDGLAISEFELSMLLAAQLFDKGLISSGQGAKMVNISKRAFIELLGKYGVSIFQYDFDDLLEDLENA